MAKFDDVAMFDPESPRQPDECRYPGDDVHVLYRRNRCMHAAECGRASKAAFDGKRAPWIEPDAVDREVMLKIVTRCPTGALVALDADGTPVAEDLPARNEVIVSPDGPLYVRGAIEVDGAGEAEPRLALCRCGTSRNKPYCDGAHARARFHDAGGIDRDAEPGAEAGAGALVVKLADNGPLLLSGPVTVRAASGRIAFVGDKVALCRCGNSQNKPFCDGAHSTLGWRSIDGDGR